MVQLSLVISLNDHFQTFSLPTAGTAISVWSCPQTLEPASQGCRACLAIPSPGGQPLASCRRANTPSSDARAGQAGSVSCPVLRTWLHIPSLLSLLPWLSHATHRDFLGAFSHNSPVRESCLQAPSGEYSPCPQGS